MRGITRKRYEVDEQPPLGPEDDPYVAYLIWKAEQDAAAAAMNGENGEDDVADDRDAVPAGAHVNEVAAQQSAGHRPVRGSWLRRLATRHRGRTGTAQA